MATDLERWKALPEPLRPIGPVFCPHCGKQTGTTIAQLHEHEARCPDAGRREVDTMTATETTTADERAADGGLTLDQCLAAAEMTRLVSATDGYLLRACRLLADELAAVRAELAALTGPAA